MSNRRRASDAKTEKRWKAVPPILYKYSSPDRLQIFSNFRVRFSQLAALNDPFELLIDMEPGAFRQVAMRSARSVLNPAALVWMALQQTFSLLRDPGKFENATFVVRIIVGVIMLPLAPLLVLLAYPFIGKYLKGFMEIIAEEFELTLGKARDGLILIFSCSETWDSVPMWAHYAGNHAGFAIGIDPRSAFSRTNSKGEAHQLQPRRVTYQDRIPTMGFGSREPDFLATKMPDWSYEREWRFTDVPDDASQRVAVPGSCEVLLFDLAPDSVREIVFGAKCTRADASRIMIALEQAGVAPEFYVVRRGPRYGFQRVRIHNSEEITEAHSDIGDTAPNIGDMNFERVEQGFLQMMKAAETHWLLGRLNKPRNRS